MLKRAKEVIESGDLKEMVDYAIEANRELKKLEPDFEAVKVSLREKGVLQAALTGEKTAVFEGNLGKAQIVFVRDEWSPREGADLLAAEAGIAPDVYSTLFVKRTVVTLAPEFEEKYAELTLAQRKVIDNLVHKKPATPRVNLPK